MPIIDSAIYHPNEANSSDAYAPFEDGNNTGSYLLNPDGSLYIGAVWPGYTVFPDWLTEAARTWWKNQIASYHGKIPIDGIWIDMSEVCTPPSLSGITAYACRSPAFVWDLVGPRTSRSTLFIHHFTWVVNLAT